jgi:hypothetical protein
VEIGSGKVLLGLVKRISPQMELIPVNSVESLESFADAFFAKTDRAATERVNCRRP